MRASPSDVDEWFDHALTYAEPGRVDPLPDDPVATWREQWRGRWFEAGGSALGRLAREQGFAVTARQLTRLGWAHHDVRREVRRGAVWVPTRGVVCPVPVDDTTPEGRRTRHAMRATAQVFAREAAVVSGRSAAILDGLPTVAVPDVPELTSPSVLTSGRHGSGHVHRAVLRGVHITEWYGAPVTTTARTLVDLGRHNRFDAIMAVDAAFRGRLVTTEAVQLALEEAVGWPGVRQARRVLDLADARAESPLESLVRLRLIEDGFPDPEPQAWIVDADLQQRFRVDFLLRERRVIIEADGRGKYTGDELWAEKRREARLRALGFRVERILWSDVFAGWSDMSRRLWALINTP